MMGTTTRLGTPMSTITTLTMDSKPMTMAEAVVAVIPMASRRPSVTSPCGRMQPAVLIWTTTVAAMTAT